MKNKKELEAFLKSHRLYSAFIRNLKKRDFKSLHEYLRHQSEDRTLKRLEIISAFPWSETEEGFNVWHDMNSKWIEKKDADSEA